MIDVVTNSMDSMTEFLRQYGYLQHDETELMVGVRRYIEFFGLDPYRTSDEDGDEPWLDLDLVRSHMSMPRCGHVDIIDADAMNGSGSWRAGCHSDWPKNHCVKIKFDYGRRPSWWEPVWDRCWLLVRQAYADMGIVLQEAKSGEQVNIDVNWEPGRGWIGLAIVGRNQTCNTRIWAKFDTRYKPGDLVNQLARLLAHEFGHNMGLSHSRGGIMNPSITSGTFKPTEWRGDPSEPYLRRWFGGQPVNIGQPPKPPTEPPTPPTEGIINSGSVYLSNGNTYSLAAPVAGQPTARLILPDGTTYNGAVAPKQGVPLSQ